MGRMWGLCELHDWAAVQALVATSALFVEQAAIDGCQYDLAWMYTGMPTPPCHLTRPNIHRADQRPYPRLADARWMSANPSFLLELDRLSNRSATAVVAPYAQQADGDGASPTE